MKYTIITMLRQGILDNAGKAVTTALATLGFEDVLDVRIGKTYFIECESNQIEDIADKLVNEVTETYSIISEDSPHENPLIPINPHIRKRLK